MRLHHAQLLTAAATLPEQQALYEDTLGLPVRTDEDGFTVTIGESQLSFAAGPGEPFYHFALLVPGDRFDAALEWIGARVALLPHSDRSEVVFDFPAWDAQACYFHDPAGNIVELIAHRGREDSGRHGAFHAAELVGLSELGLVGTPTQLAPPLTGELGLPVWDGRVADEDALAFVGAPARTLILVPTGRGWLPTGRPGEPHSARVEILAAGDGARSAELASGLYRVVRRPQ